MSNAPRIYVRGSYIDIHGNQNVYLSVDKDGEVKISIAEPQLKQPASAPTVMWQHSMRQHLIRKQ